MNKLLANNSGIFNKKYFNESLLKGQLDIKVKNLLLTPYERYNIINLLQGVAGEKIED